MYPKIKKRKKKNKKIIRNFFMKLFDDSRSFFGSLKSPKRFFRYIKKTFHF